MTHSNLIDPDKFARLARAVTSAEDDLNAARAAVQQSGRQENTALTALDEAKDTFECYVAQFKGRASW